MSIPPPRHFTDREYAELAAFYDRHGAVRLEGFLDPGTVRTVLAEVDAAAAASAGTGRVPGRARSYGHGRGRMTIREQSEENPLVREFLFRREMAEPIARIARTRILQFWFDLTFIHEASDGGEAGEGSSWHHDIAAFAFKGEKLPSLWMALTPATLQQSRLEFIDGSHRTVPGFFRPPTTRLPEDDGMLRIPDYDALVAEGRERILAWDCAPGDALIIHPYTIHGSRGNAGSRDHGRRVAITTRWLGEDVRWLPLDRKLGGFAARLEGQPQPPNGSRPAREIFPVVWEE